MRSAAAATTALLLLAACGDPPAARATTAAAQGPTAIEHDFGVIPHGASREHDFVLDLASLGDTWIPLHVQLDCSCGHASLWLRGADGTDRPIDGRPIADNAPRAGERVVARVVIDTALREAVDQEKTVSRGWVVLQSARDGTGASRIRWPLLLRFGVDAPVTLRPYAALDFDRVPTCLVAERMTTLAGDAAHREVAFTGVETSDPALEAALEPRDDHVVLRVRCRPGDLGNHRAAVRVTTDLPDGYAVLLPVTWKVVPEVEAQPMAKISFRADLGREQTDAEATGQFVVVTDHDPTRTAEFAVRAVVDAAGRDAGASFAFRFEPVPGQPRQHRLYARYLGGQPDGFRGRILLTKPDSDGPELPLDLVVFPTRDS